MKKAFTLAEVLITLTIIGVVAALAAPALIEKTQQAKVGPTLSKFTNTYENATQQLFYRDDIGRLSLLDGTDGISFANGTGFGDKLADNMTLDKMETSKYAEYKKYKYTAGTVADQSSDERPYYLLKDGSMFYLVGGASGEGTLCQLVYDINGIRKPNRVGKDVFKFVIADNGRLYPFGSRAHKNINSDLEKVNCSLAGSADEAFACTGAVADNNWRAEYKDSKNTKDKEENKEEDKDSK